MTPSPIALTEELQRFRKKLLDLSLRNPLLSYRYSQRRTIPLPKIDADALYQALVEDEQQLPLIPIPDPQPPVEENNLPPGSPPTPAPGAAGNRPHRSPPQPSENTTTASSRTTDRSNA
ncbi:MAG: DUF4011 domain-containing protein, partial [Pirellulaceae bacterium]